MFKNVRKVNLWYKSHVPAWQKIATFGGTLLAVFLISNVGGYPALPAVGIVAVILTFIHISITNYGLVPVLGVWAVNLLMLPAIAFSFISYAPDETLVMTVTVATISLLLSSLLWTYFAYKFSSGKLWVTLATIFIIQTFVTLVCSMLLGWWQWAAFVALGAGAMGYFARYYFVKGYKKRKVSKRDGRKSEETYQSLAPLLARRKEAALKALNDAKGITVVSTGSDTQPAVLMSKRGVFAVFFHSVDQTIDFAGKNAPSYKKNPLSPFLALLLRRTAEQVAGIKGVYTILAVDDNALKHNGVKADVMSFENRIEGSVIVSHHMSLLRTISQLPVTPLTEDVVAKVIAYGKRHQ